MVLLGSGNVLKFIYKINLLLWLTFCIPFLPFDFFIMTNCLTSVFFFNFSVKLQDFQLFINHIVIYERENGLPTITVYNLPSIGEAIGALQDGRKIDFIDPIYSADAEESQFSSSILRFAYSSLRTPPSVYDFDMKAGVSVLKKIEKVVHFFYIVQTLMYVSR